MTVKNRFRELLIAKAADEDRRSIPLTEVESVTKVTWNTLQSWDKNEIKRFDRDVLVALCEYFACDVGDLLYLTPNGDKPSDPAP